MPTYEYKCTQNGELFELWQEVGAEAPPCPSCGAPSKKVFRPTRVIFKGSGFYVTDTRAESQGSASSSADEAKADSPSESAKTETASEKSADASAPKEAASTSSDKR